MTPVLGKNIRAARIRRKLTGAELAAKLGLIWPNTIYRWESGVSAPSIPMLEKVAKALGTTASDLLS